MNVLDTKSVLLPIPGTVRWETGSNGEAKAIGVWGRDFPCFPHVVEPGGRLRELTRQERRWAERMARKSGGSK